MPVPFFKSRETLQMFILQSSNEQFREHLSVFSLNELTESLTLLQAQPIIEAKNKLDSLFEWVDSSIGLEVLGGHMSVSSFLNFLDFLNQFPQYQNRLNFILVGLSSSVFSQALSFFLNCHLCILKTAGILEPLQYQLIHFAHEGEKLQKNITQHIQQFKQEIASIKPQELTQNILHELIDQIDHLRNQLLAYLESMTPALTIVWHTNRIDLIENFSSIHELLQHQLSHDIGHSFSDQLPATGLYAHLNLTFSRIFDSSLKDDDAAIEGLAQLSIWHLKDYWELGLLPMVQCTKELSLDAEKYSEKECIDHQNHLIHLVQKQLELLGILTIRDLKRLHLFSKDLFKAYRLSKLK